MSKYRAQQKRSLEKGKEKVEEIPSPKRLRHIGGSSKVPKLVPLFQAIRESPSLRHLKLQFWNMSLEQFSWARKVYENDRKQKFKTHVPPVDLNQGQYVTCEESGNAVVEHYTENKDSWCTIRDVDLAEAYKKSKGSLLFLMYGWPDPKCASMDDKGCC